MHIPTFSKTKYLSSHIGVHIDKLAFGIKDFYFESKFDNSTDHLHSRWHWEALGPQPIFVPRGWSTSGKNFSFMLSSALPYSGLFLDLWLSSIKLFHFSEFRQQRRRKTRDWSRWPDKDFSLTENFGSARLPLLIFTTPWMKFSGEEYLSWQTISREILFLCFNVGDLLLTNICQALLCWGEWELDEPNVEPDDEPSPEAHFFEAGWGWRSFRNLCKILILSSIRFQLNLLSILKRQMLRLCDPPWNQSMVCSWRRDMNTLETSCNSASSLSSSSCNNKKLHLCLKILQSSLNLQAQVNTTFCDTARVSEGLPGCLSEAVRGAC